MGLKLCEASFLNFSQNTTMDMPKMLSFHTKVTQTVSWEKICCLYVAFAHSFKVSTTLHSGCFLFLQLNILFVSLHLPQVKGLGLYIIYALQQCPFHKCYFVVYPYFYETYINHS